MSSARKWLIHISSPPTAKVSCKRENDGAGLPRQGRLAPHRPQGCGQGCPQVSQRSLAPGPPPRSTRGCSPPPSPLRLARPRSSCFLGQPGSLPRQKEGFLALSTGLTATLGPCVRAHVVPFSSKSGSSEGPGRWLWRHRPEPCPGILSELTAGSSSNHGGEGRVPARGDLCVRRCGCGCVGGEVPPLTPLCLLLWLKHHLLPQEGAG